MHGEQGNLTKEQFAQELLRALKRQRVHEYDRYDAESFTLRGPGPDKLAALNLENFYAEHCATPESERSKHYQRIAATVREMPEALQTLNRETIRPKLVPRLWTRLHWLNQCDDPERKRPLEIGAEPVGEHFVLTVAADLGGAYATLDHAGLQHFGLEFAEALAIARRNLAPLEVRMIGLRFHDRETPRAFEFATVDGNDAARVALPELFAELPTRGTPIVVAPNAGSLLVAGEDDDDMLDLILQRAQELVKQPRAICGLALRLRDGRWEDWAPPLVPEHGLSDLRKEVNFGFRSLRTEHLAHAYAQRAKSLEAELAAAGRKLRVAPQHPIVAKSPKRIMLTAAAWGPDDPSLLPECDMVGLMVADDAALTVVWDDLLRAAGPQMVPDDTCYPRRWLVESFLDDATIAELKKSDRAKLLGGCGN